MNPLKLLKVNRKSLEDTIAAIATPPGEGAIGIVRLSGGQAVAIAASVFRSSHGRDLLSSSGRVFHGEIVDPNAIAEGALDEVIVHRMRGPASYTGEDIVEINCHGGPALLAEVLALLLRQGARLAAPGEFTQRAFLNGRLDLVQAEAVIDRIQARTHAALRAAASAAGGALSEAIHSLRDTLANALARVEAAVDFPEEDLPELVDEALRGELAQARSRIADLVETARAGRLYREGASVPIVGRPNVGKSSLFNALLREARAIVTEHAGTTRDLLHEAINLEGVPVRLTDTAGLRAAQGDAERIGVSLAKNAIQTADAILFVLDLSVPPTPEDEELATWLAGLDTPAMLVWNKKDLAAAPFTPPCWHADFPDSVCVSAQSGEGLRELENRLRALLMGHAHASPAREIVTRVHQVDSLRRAGAALDALLSHYASSPEFLSLDLREALDALGEITGETTPEDILDRIFAQFCLGK